MKKFLIIFFLSFNFIAQADDIKDFQIGGLSIGESMLNYISEKEIKSSKKNYLKGNKKYYVIGYDKFTKVYDDIDVYLKTGDNKYIIRTIGAGLYVNYNNCKLKAKNIAKEIEGLFPNIKPETFDDIVHSYDKTKKSKLFQISFLLNKNGMDDHIRVECTDWSEVITKKNGWEDNLKVVAFSKEILQWFADGYN
jgi:hypothetical protein